MDTGKKKEAIESGMGLEEFGERLVGILKPSLDGECEVSCGLQERLNAGCVPYITMKRPGCGIAPSFRLNELYGAYLEGKNIFRLAEEIKEAYFMAAPGKEEEQETEGLLKDKKRVMERLFIRAVNTKKNREMLKNIPHWEVLDLSIVCSIMAAADDKGVGSIVVTDAMREMYGWEEDEMIRYAIKNSPRLFPAKIQTMFDTLKGFLPPGAEEEMPDAVKYGGGYILSNRAGVNGFSAVFYPGVLQKFSKEQGADLIIIPSSIHEALILPDDGRLGIEEAERMVREVNAECVSETEQLSERVYYYSRKDGKIGYLSDYREKRA